MTSYNVPIVEIKMVVRETLPAGAIRGSITKPADVHTFAHEIMKDLDREQFSILTLNIKNVVTGYHVVSIGSLNASIVHPREIFKAAILKNAASVILIHNHPSGNPEPSSEDLEVTKRLNDAGHVLGIPVKDHIIMGNETFFSFRDRGLL